jgi:hypothetical protein
MCDVTFNGMRKKLNENDNGEYIITSDVRRRHDNKSFHLRNNFAIVCTLNK